MLFSIWDRLVEISFSQLIKIIKATHAHRLSNSTKAFDDNSARNEKNALLRLDSAAISQRGLQHQPRNLNPSQLGAFTFQAFTYSNDLAHLINDKYFKYFSQSAQTNK